MSVKGHDIVPIKNRQKVTHGSLFFKAALFLLMNIESSIDILSKALNASFLKLFSNMKLDFGNTFKTLNSNSVVYSSRGYNNRVTLLIFGVDIWDTLPRSILHLHFNY